MFGMLRLVWLKAGIFFLSLWTFSWQPSRCVGYASRFRFDTRGSSESNHRRLGHNQVGFCCRRPVRRQEYVPERCRTENAFPATRGLSSSSMRFSTMRLPLLTTWIPHLSSSHSHSQAFRLGTSTSLIYILYSSNLSHLQEWLHFTSRGHW